MENTIYDNYASAALQVLIEKTPVISIVGENKDVKSQEEEYKLRLNICRTAHAYAMCMMQIRQEYIDYLNSIGIELT